MRLGVRLAGSGLVLLFLCIQVFSAPRIALIGAGESGENFADLILTGCGEFEFVERSEIRHVLEERKLQAQTLGGDAMPDLAGVLRVSIFAVVEGDAPGEMLRITLFETTNGIRLGELLLEAGEAKPERVTAELRRVAALLQNPGNATFLSFGDITDFGVPERYKREGKECAATTRRCITTIPGILALERSHLSRLRAERKLTGDFGKLVGAARMVCFQLIPGMTSETNSCRLQLTDADGNILFERAASASDPATPGILAAGLADFLKKSPPPAEKPEDRGREAARFFAAARLRTRTRAGDNSDTLNLYRTAMELAPAQEYKEGLAQCMFRIIDRIPAAETADLLELLELTRDDFDDPNLSSGYNNSLRQLYLCCRELDVSRCEAIRRTAEKSRESSLRKWREGNRSINWQNDSDFAHCLYLGFELIAPHLWFDDRRYLENASDMLGEIETLFDIRARLPVPPETEKNVFAHALGNARSMLSDLPTEAAVIAAERLAARFDTVSGPDAADFAAQMRFYAALRLAGNDTAKIREACRTALRTASPEKNFENCLQTCYCLNESNLQKNVNYVKIFRKEADGFNIAHKEPTPFETLLQLSIEKCGSDPAFLLKPGQTSMFAHLLNSAQLANYSQEELARLNPGFQFTLLTRPTASIRHTDMPPDGMLYYTLDKPHTLELHRLDPATGKTERLNHLKKEKEQDAPQPGTMQIHDGIAAIALQEQVLLLPLDGSSPARIRNWPGGVNAAVFFRGRVWGIGPRLLASADSDGNNRAVHFSWLDENRTEQKELRGKAGDYELFLFLIPEPDTETLLLFTTTRAFRFRPESGKLEMLPGRFFSQVAFQRIGNNVTVGMTSNSNPGIQCIEWNGADKMWTAPALTRPLSGKLDMQEGNTVDPQYGLSGAFCRQNGLIWAAGDLFVPSRLLNPQTPERSPFWLHPAVKAFYPHPDGHSVLMVTQNRIVRVTPP